MRINYTTADEERLYDIATITKELGINKSKIYRSLNKLSNVEIIQHQNKYLYTESTILLLIEKLLLEKITQ